MKLILSILAILFLLVTIVVVRHVYRLSVHTSDFNANVCYGEILSDLHRKIEEANDQKSQEMHEENERYLGQLLARKDTPCEDLRTKMKSYNQANHADR